MNSKHADLQSCLADNHSTVMEKLSEINRKLAYEEGRANGTRKAAPVVGRRLSLKEMAIAFGLIVVAAGSAIAAVVAALK